MSIYRAGVKIAGFKCCPEAGTLGCFGVLNADPKTTVLITCHHVAYMGTRGTGAPVYDPCCCCSGDLIGRMVAPDNAIGTVPGSVIGVDFAIATVNPGITVINEVKGLGPDKAGGNKDRIVGVAPLQPVVVGGQTFQSPVKPGDVVRRCGSTTGVQTGKVVDIRRNVFVIEPMNTEATLAVLGGKRTLPMPGQMLIDFENESESGDSGAVIVNEMNQVVALFCGRSESVHYATEISFVLSLLKVTIPATLPPPLAATTHTAATVPFEVLGPGALMDVEPEADLAEAAGVLRRLHQELARSEAGRALLSALESSREEVVDLVNRRRPVTVAWHRNHGPAFLNRTVEAARRGRPVLHREERGVPLSQLLRTMADVLARHGSEALRARLSAHGPWIIEAAERCRTLDDLAEIVRGPALDHWAPAGEVA